MSSCEGKQWYKIDFQGKDGYICASLIEKYYDDEEEIDFYPEVRCVGKAIMLTEEMHRLHVNTWKNFPWFDYMYEGKPLGIDLKKGDK